MRSHSGGGFQGQQRFMDGRNKIGSIISRLPDLSRARQPPPGSGSPTRRPPPARTPRRAGPAWPTGGPPSLASARRAAARRLPPVNSHLPAFGRVSAARASPLSPPCLCPQPRPAPAEPPAHPEPRRLVPPALRPEMSRHARQRHPHVQDGRLRPQGPPRHRRAAVPAVCQCQCQCVSVSVSRGAPVAWKTARFGDIFLDKNRKGYHF